VPINAAQALPLRCLKVSRHRQHGLPHLACWEVCVGKSVPLTDIAAAHPRMTCLAAQGAQAGRKRTSRAQMRLSRMGWAWQHVRASHGWRAAARRWCAGARGTWTRSPSAPCRARSAAAATADRRRQLCATRRRGGTSTRWRSAATRRPLQRCSDVSGLSSRGSGLDESCSKARAGADATFSGFKAALSHSAHRLVCLVMLG